MSITAADLILYGAASRPNDDVATTGGAIATADRPTFTQFASAARPEFVSDGADVRTVTVVGRDDAGAIQSEGPTALDGATPVLFANTFERILTVTLSATDGSRSVTMAEGTGGTIRATIVPNQTSISAGFRRSTSEGTEQKRYEKVFFKNTHGTLSLTTAELELTADPASKIKIGGATSKDDSGTVTNRKTAPGGVTFVDDSVAQAVPTGALDAGEAIGCWIEQTLEADDAPVRSTYTLQLAGQTT